MAGREARRLGLCQVTLGALVAFWLASCQMPSRPSLLAPSVPGWRVVERWGDARQQIDPAAWAPLEAGDAAPLGRLLATGHGSRLLLAEDGVQLLAGPDSAFVLAAPAAAKEIRQSSGWLRYRVATGAAPVRITTPTIAVQVARATLAIQIGAAGTDIEVESGEASIQSADGHHAITLRPGQAARANATAAAPLALRHFAGGPFMPLEPVILPAMRPAASVASSSRWPAPAPTAPAPNAPAAVGSAPNESPSPAIASTSAAQTPSRPGDSQAVGAELGGPIDAPHPGQLAAPSASGAAATAWPSDRAGPPLASFEGRPLELPDTGEDAMLGQVAGAAPQQPMTSRGAGSQAHGRRSLAAPATRPVDAVRGPIPLMPAAAAAPADPALVGTGANRVRAAKSAGLLSPRRPAESGGLQDHAASPSRTAYRSAARENPEASVAAPMAAADLNRRKAGNAVAGGPAEIGGHEARARRPVQPGLPATAAGSDRVPAGWSGPAASDADRRGPWPQARGPIALGPFGAADRADPMPSDPRADARSKRTNRDIIVQRQPADSGEPRAQPRGPVPLGPVGVIGRGIAAPAERQAGVGQDGGKSHGAVQAWPADDGQPLAGAPAEQSPWADGGADGASTGLPAAAGGIALGGAWLRPTAPDAAGSDHQLELSPSADRW